MADPSVALCTPCKHRPFDEKERLRCLFCSGSQCSKCGPKAYLSLERPALNKIHSSWITDFILAMQRPSESMFNEANLVEQFRRNRVAAVFNLTEPGEHPYCGCGNQLYSGFPYNPERLMAANIKHFNYCWKDMTVPSMNLMMDIVHVAQNEICAGNKIAVHCHAGFGRTGVTISCLLIAMDSFTADEAINIVRLRRPGSIQTKAQQGFVYEFEKYFRQCISVFPIVYKEFQLVPKSIVKSVQDQYYSLSLDELQDTNLRFISKLVMSVTQVFSDPSILDNILPMSVLCTAFSGLSEQGEILDFLAQIEEDYFPKVMNELNDNIWNTIFVTASALGRDDPDELVILGITTTNKFPSAHVKGAVYFVLAQLLLAWIETRSDALFDNNFIVELDKVWSESGGQLQLYCPSLDSTGASLTPVSKETSTVESLVAGAASAVEESAKSGPSSGKNRSFSSPSGSNKVNCSSKLNDPLMIIYKNLAKTLQNGLSRIKLTNVSAVISMLTQFHQKVLNCRNPVNSTQDNDVVNALPTIPGSVVEPSLEVQEMDTLPSIGASVEKKERSASAKALPLENKDRQSSTSSGGVSNSKLNAAEKVYKGLTCLDLILLRVAIAFTMCRSKGTTLIEKR